MTEFEILKLSTTEFVNEVAKGRLQTLSDDERVKYYSLIVQRQYKSLGISDQMKYANAVIKQRKD